MLWNEPNNLSHWDFEIDPEWKMFAEMVNSASDAIRAENSKLPIVLGGIFEQTTRTTVDKVPFLGDIPVVGNLFKRTIKQDDKTELLIFLTPHVAHNPDVLKPMSTDELRGTRLTPNAVEKGTFDEHIRGLERGTTRPASP